MEQAISMTDNLFLSVVLVCNLGYGFAGFVFSPVGVQPAANHAATTDLKWKGHAMAEELEKVQQSELVLRSDLVNVLQLFLPGASREFRANQAVRGSN